MSLTTALASGHRPGYTLYLRGGVYAGEFDSTLRGDNGLPMVIRPYPGERAIIDGALDINGAFTTWIGLEIRYSGWVTRVSQEPGNVPSDLPRRDLNIYGVGTRLINCIIHDLSNFGWWGPATDSELYGCLIYSNGWAGPDRGHGHGVYTQNRPGGRKVWRDCITWGHYSTCGKVYSASNAPLKHYDISGLICGPSGDSRFLVGSDDGSTEDVTVSGVMTYGAAVNFSDALLSSSIAFDQCYIVSDKDIPIVLSSWHNLTGLDNTIIGGNGDDPSYRVVALAANRGAWQLDRNSYHYTGPNPRPFREEGIADRTFAQWQQVTGLDAQSTYQRGAPTANKVVVQPNEYDPNRFHVAVWNWEGLASIPAPLTGRYTNAQNTSEQITCTKGDPLPMHTWSTVAPIGASAPIAAHDPRFCCFIVEAPAWHSNYLPQIAR